MLRSMVLVAALGLAACGAAFAPTFAPDGRQAYAITCHGNGLSWGDCLYRAGELCKAAGYDVIARDGEGGAVVGGGSWGLFGGTTSQRSMVIACKA